MKTIKVTPLDTPIDYKKISPGYANKKYSIS